jgi:two-component system, NarL family, sensor histidine kinase UhpB
VGDTHELYRKLLEHSPVSICLASGFRMTFLNPAALRLIGASDPEQLLGRSLFDIFSPDDHARLQCHLSTVADAERIARFDARIIRFDNVALDIEVISAALDAAEPPSVQLVLTDITDRKRTENALRESEERLTLAFAGAQEGVWDWNLETGAVVYSPRWKQMLGYDPDGDEIEPHVRAWERLLHPDDKALADRLNESVKRGARTYEGEFRLRHKDGHYVPVLSRGFPVRREPGGPAVRIVGTHFDLTERKKAEAERARTELLTRLVFAQEDERRRISREMHDRFGEQLTALARRVAMLKESCAASPELQTSVEAIESVSQELDRAVDHLVWELRPTALDDLGLRAALANYLQDWSKRVNISAELHAVGLLDDRLPSDAESALYRIAQEALTNIAKHARASNVDVILERRGDHVLLIVEDDGIGFDAADVESERQGFGLSGMHERAALVGATLEIESATGKGTTILVRMDLSKAGGAESVHA